MVFPLPAPPCRITIPLSGCVISSNCFGSISAVISDRGLAATYLVPPVQAVAIDDDPSSPTYAGTGPGTSPYGRVTEFYASPLLETVGQAQAAANTILARKVGAGATYTLVRPYDPTISAGDVVSLEGSGLAVDAVTLNLTGDTALQVREL